MANRGDHVVAVLGSDVVLLEGELTTRSERGALAGRVHRTVACFFLFHADLRHRLAVPLDDVLTRVVENLVLGCVGQVDHRAGGRQQAETGSLEVIVGPAPFARSELVMMLPARHVIGRQRARRIRDGALGTVGVGAGRVGQYHRMLAVRVAKEEEDPLVLHQSRDEIERRLTILHAVFPLGKRALKFEGIVTETEVLEDGRDDVRRREVLEDSGNRSYD